MQSGKLSKKSLMQTHYKNLLREASIDARIRDTLGKVPLKLRDYAPLSKPGDPNPDATYRAGKAAFHAAKKREKTNEETDQVDEALGSSVGATVAPVSKLTPKGLSARRSHCCFLLRYSHCHES